MVTLAPLILGEDALSDIRAYLRIEQDEEDPLLLSLMGAATGHCEAFLGQVVIARTANHRLNVSQDWQRLGATPVRSIGIVTGIPADSASFTLLNTAYNVDIDSNADGWIQVTRPGGAGRIDVVFTVGVALEWGSLPEPIRLAIIRLAAHLYAVRDSSDDVAPPAIVAALLRPWRRMRLS